MNKTDIVNQIIIFDTLRKDERIRMRVYELCSYEHKCRELCFKDKECHNRNPINFYWSAMSALN